MIKDKIIMIIVLSYDLYYNFKKFKKSKILVLQIKRCETENIYKMLILQNEKMHVVFYYHCSFIRHTKFKIQTKFLGKVTKHNI